MNNTTATNSSFTYHIKKVENLYIDQLELATPTHIYIDKVKHLHIGKIKIASPATSYEQPPTSPHQPSTQPTLTNSQLVLLFYYLLGSLGIWLRLHVDLAPIARFMHLLTGKTYTNLRNSEY